MKLGTKRFQSHPNLYRPSIRSAALCNKCIAAVLWLCGCSANPGPVSPTELSKPHDALMTFLTALGQGNAARARACSAGTDQDKRWIDGMVALVSGLREYDQALLERFGRQAVPIDVDLKQAIFSMANEPIIRFQEGIVKESEDTAEIDAAIGHIRLMAQQPVYLKREKSGWKVDLAAMRESPRHSPESIEQNLAAGRALKAAARDVRTRRYKTLDEAQQALGEKPGA